MTLPAGEGSHNGLSAQFLHRRAVRSAAVSRRALEKGSREGGRVQAFRPEVTARLVELAPLLLGRLDDMNDRMVEMLLSTEPAYREFAAHAATELRTSTRAGIERGVRGLVGALPKGASMAGAREVGRRRAAQGIPLEAVLRAYRYAGQVMWEGLLDVAEVAGRRHDPLLL